MTQKEWVDMIWPLAVKACEIVGGYLPEILTAQTCQETGYGETDLSQIGRYNVVGMKKELLNDTWTSEFWHGKTYSKVTPEWYGGKKTMITDVFRVYDSYLDGLCDYVQFMRDARYEKGGHYKYRDVLAISDPETLIETVRSRGYCTDPSYTTSVMAIVRKWDLTSRDKGGTPAKTYKSVREALAALGVDLIDRVAENSGEVPAHNSNSHDYFGVHYLGVNGINPDLYGGGYGGHYFIYPDGRCSQAALPTDKIWHVGASSGFKYIHPDARNHNTVGVECATFTKSGRNNDDETWYFHEETQVTAAKLSAAFLTVYKLPIDHLLRHGDVTTKNCPSPLKRDQGLGSNWTWERFKSEVQKYMAQLAGKQTVTLRKGSSGADVIKLQNDLDALGYYNIKQNAAGLWYEERLSADGDFGPKTEEQVLLFQKYEGLDCDGIAGPKTLGRIAERISEMSGVNSTENFTMDDLEKTILKIVSEAKEKDWLYGNSHVYPPCADGYISCDRLISLALYRHGIRHQPNGGWCGSNLEKALVSMGWVKAADPEKVTGKAVVVMYKDGDFCHAFWQSSYDPKTKLCTKYDTGDTWRWAEHTQPFKDVPRNEWHDKRYVGAVYTMPAQTSKSKIIRLGQQHSINFTGHRIADDGIYGAESREQAIRVIQRAANLDYSAHLVEDGKRGPLTDAVMAGHYVELGENQFMVTAVEICAMLVGKDPHGVELPGTYGEGLASCLGTNKFTYAQLLAMIGA